MSPHPFTTQLTDALNTASHHTIGHALHAVIAEHRPTDADVGAPVCTECSNTDDINGPYTRWPCPTLNIIAGALGIGAPQDVR